MANVMTSAHWKRQEFDPVNSNWKMNFALEKEQEGNEALWGGYPWVDYWTDKQGNVVRYEFTYPDVENSSSVPPALFQELQKACVLKGVVLFYPKETWKAYMNTVAERQRSRDKGNVK